MIDFDYVVAPAAVVILGMAVALVSVRRLRRPATLTRRILLTVLAFVGLFAAVLSGSNAFLLHVSKSRLPGKIYLVNGHRMRIDCMGSGSPTLILEAGGGNDGMTWVGVQPVLAQTTRVCSYDRAGFGGSDPLPAPRDADHVAIELHALLQAAEVAPPFVLMGHSMGGLFIRDYAARYPAEVAGLIFVDSSTPSQESYPVFVAAAENHLKRSLTIQEDRALFILGIPRLLGVCSKAHFRGLDARAAKQLAEDRCHEPFSTIADEEDGFIRSGEETRGTGPYGALPILIFSHDPAAEDPNHHMDALEHFSDQLQGALLQLSTRSRRIIAEGSLHFVHLDRPDLIEREVARFIQQVRETAPPPVYGTTVTE